MPASASVDPAGARRDAAAPSTSTPPAPGSSTASSPPTASSAPGMQRVLLVGSETMSRIVDWEDRSTAILFGDGAGAVVLEQGDGPGPAPRLGPRLRRLAAPPPPRRRRRHHRDGRPRGVPPGRADHGRLRRAGPRPRRRHRRRRRTSSSPTRPTRASSPRRAPSSASPRSAPPTSSPPPATRRPPRSRWPWPTPPTPAGSHPGDLVLLIGFGAGMSWASAVIEWAA